VPEWQAARVAKGEDPNDQKALSDYLDYQGIENPFKARPAQAATGRAATTQGTSQPMVNGKRSRRPSIRRKSLRIAEIDRQNSIRRDQTPSTTSWSGLQGSGGG
jgi:hypothetical protein